MFIVTSVSPLDVYWQDRDVWVKKAAGRNSDYNEAEYSTDRAGPGTRMHIWVTRTFREARKMKAILEKIDGVRVTIREK